MNTYHHMLHGSISRYFNNASDQQLCNSPEPACLRVSHSYNYKVSFLFILFLFLSTAVCTVSAEIQFEEVTSAAGLNHTGESWGIAWGDFNGDGKPDVYSNNHREAPSLWLNNGDGTFSGVASTVILNRKGIDTHGVAWADFDNDGDQDLIELTGGGAGLTANPQNVPNFFTNFYINKNGVLHESAADWGIRYPELRGRTPLWLDWDKDGMLDIVMAGEPQLDGTGGTRIFRNDSVMFQDKTAETQFDCDNATLQFLVIADLVGDDGMELMCHSTPFPSKLYDTASVPFLDVADQVFSGITKNNIDDIAIADFNGDLQQDIFMVQTVSGYSGVFQSSASQLRAVIRSGRLERGIRFTSSGNLDFIFTNFFISNFDIYIGSTGWHPDVTGVWPKRFSLSSDDPTVKGIKEHTPGTDGGIYIGYDEATQEWQVLISAKGGLAHYMYQGLIESDSTITDVMPIGFQVGEYTVSPTLLINGDDGFEDRSLSSGFIEPISCAYSVAGDFDNDMDVDIYLSCGGSASNISNILYENVGDGSFNKVETAGVAAGGAAGSELGQGQNVAIADYDEDGFLDLYLTNGRGEKPINLGPDQLFRNVGNANHWIEIDLEGVVSNRDGIGAKVYVTTPDGKTQLREQSGGMHRFAQNHKRLHFGLASNTKVANIEIIWPNGIIQNIENISVDQVLRVIEPVKPELLGKPSYRPSVDSGVYVWKDTINGSYHVRTSGPRGLTIYQVKLVSSKPLGQVVPVGMESNDILQTTSHGLTFTSIITGGQDGFDIEIPPGSEILISVKQDGVANPRQLHVGASGQPLSPVGWVVSANSLPERPIVRLGNEFGLFIGWSPNKDKLEARWTGGSLLRKAAFSIITAESYRSITKVGLESSDQVRESPNTLSVKGWAARGWDGVDLDLVDSSTDVGVIYQQDGLFPPHRVYSKEEGLGMPNAYRLN